MGEDVMGTVLELVTRAAAASPERPALLAPERSPLTYRGLNELVAGQAAGLRAAGIGPADRVALVVPNGPEAATSFLITATAGVSAPLNPVYTARELDFYLSDLRARAVVVAADLDSPVREVASSHGIEVLELEVDRDAPAGVFALRGLTPASERVEPEAASEALVLHTSGTTARPKLVPLLHRNLVTSARNVVASLELGPDDRCLNVMPLFHIHGLVAALLASLHAGGSVACTPGFHQIRVFDWLRELDPTWYTAVPTMHQALLARVEAAPELVEGHGLRFARSSSASLPPPVLEGLEKALGVPVVEAYGMTEAAHQMASNPLPPKARKPGAVGPSAGPEIAILDAAGTVLPPGEVGEVAIRGENAFAGYEANADANAQAFTDGWFRTGDEGFLDPDGYLVLRGRIKELINRGGEKVSPLEVDGVLLQHDAVAQAVTFAVPHPQLGEDVAAAVVLAPGAAAEERELQDFVVQQLAPFKVPRRIVLVDEIPKGPTGKLQRLGLAEVLGVEVEQSSDRWLAETALELEIQKIFESVLDIPRPGVHDDFFALGGDSILGAEAVARLRDLLGRPDIPLISIVRAPTAEAMARELTEPTPGGQSLVTIKAGSGPPLVLVHGVDGDIVGFAALAHRLGDDQAVIGVRARGIDGDEAPHATVEEAAADYVRELRRVQPTGPYYLGGYCAGGGVALHMAHLLSRAGEDVGLLVLIDPLVATRSGLSQQVWLTRYRGWCALRLARNRELLDGLRQRRARRVVSATTIVTPVAQPDEATTPVQDVLMQARDAYVGRRVAVPVAFVATESYSHVPSDDGLWGWLLRGPVERFEISGRHELLFHHPSVDALAERLAPVLQRAQERPA
jgi:oxalate---CoA ligase